MWKRRFLASLERKRGGREKSLLGVTWYLESHQPQLESIGQLAGLLLPGWLRSDITGSHHLLALNGDKGGCTEVQGGGSEGRQSTDSLLLKEITSSLSAKHWGTQGRRKVGSTGQLGLCSGTHTQVGGGPEPGESQSSFSTTTSLGQGLVWCSSSVKYQSFLLFNFYCSWGSEKTHTYKPHAYWVVDTQLEIFSPTLGSPLSPKLSMILIPIAHSPLHFQNAMERHERWVKQCTVRRSVRGRDRGGSYSTKHF